MSRRPTLPLLLALAAVAACDGEVRGPLEATTLHVLPAASTLGVGDTVRLLAVDREGRRVRGVAYRAGNRNVVVDSAGLLHGVRPGHATVTALSPRQDVQFTVPVTVRGATIARADSAGAPAGATIAVAEGDSAHLAAAVFGLAGTDSTLRWIASDTTRLSVAPDGTVQARRPGAVSVTVVAAADPRVVGTATVLVTPAAPPKPAP